MKSDKAGRKTSFTDQQKAENVNIQPGKSKDYNWTVYSAEHNLGKAKACIETYEFYDNSAHCNCFEYNDDNINKSMIIILSSLIAF